MAREDPADGPDLFPYIDLRRARLCLDCEVIFEGPRCPACSSESYVPLTRWIRSTVRRVTERPAPNPAPPPAPASKPKQILKKSLYVGLGVYGVWKMLFQPSRPRRRKPPQPPPEEPKA